MTTNWLNITAVNGIEIVYVEVAMLVPHHFSGVMVPQRGVIITGDLNPEVVAYLPWWPSCLDCGAHEC